MSCLLIPSVGLGMSLSSMHSAIQCRRPLHQEDKTRKSAGYDNPSTLAGTNMVSNFTPNDDLRTRATTSRLHTSPIHIIEGIILYFRWYLYRNVFKDSVKMIQFK